MHYTEQLVSVMNFTGMIAHTLNTLAYAYVPSGYMARMFYATIRASLGDEILRVNNAIYDTFYLFLYSALLWNTHLEYFIVS